MSEFEDNFVQHTLKAIEHGNKEYWARKLWPERFYPIIAGIKEMLIKKEPLVQELKQLLEECDDPSFVQHLSRLLKKHETTISPSLKRDRKTVKNWPKLNQTTNQVYGRFAQIPLEDGGPIVNRVSYVRNRKLGP